MAAGVPHPIPYQGSKRRLAPLILEHAPARVETLFEPFAGSGALTLAAASRGLARRHVLGDSLAPLARLWGAILERPGELADEYAALWEAQGDDPARQYARVRDAFNAEGGAARLLFLLARCVKNAVRFNAAGAFNQSADRRRRGTRPERMRARIEGAHRLLAGRAEAHAAAFEALLERASPRDLVYLDPPWEGTTRGADKRYHQGLARERFVAVLERLRRRGGPFLVSYDGRSGARSYGAALPAELGLARVELHAGRSSQATLNGGRAETIESLYVSPELARDGLKLRRSVSELR